MIVSIDLLHVLRRNKSDLKTFINKNNLKSYDLFLKYCHGRKFIPCTKEEYEEAKGVKKESKQTKPEEVKPAPKKTATRRRKTPVKKEPARKASIASKPKGRRASTKKQSKS